MPTIKQKKAFTFYSENLRNPKPIPLGEILIQSGYTISQSKRPSDVIKSKGFQELLEENMPDELLQQTHIEVLQAKGLAHQVFPLSMSDEEITELVEKFGGVVQKFKHGDTATHVWYFIADHQTRLKAVKLGYEVKGQLTKNDRTPDPGSTTYNTFINNSTINPNAPKAKELAEETIRILMEKTKVKPVVQNTTENN